MEKQERVKASVRHFSSPTGKQEFLESTFTFNGQKIGAVKVVIREDGKYTFQLTDDIGEMMFATHEKKLTNF